MLHGWLRVLRLSQQYTVLFVCVHNAGRSQMAETLFNDFAAEQQISARAVSAGTVPGSQVNSVAKQVMAEIGHPMDSNSPKHLTQGIIAGASRIITMGCGVDAAACPARVVFSDDWGLDDPAGQPIESVREIRDQIVSHVQQLLADIKAER